MNPAMNPMMNGQMSPLNAANKARLTDQQKKENHINSEKKRREAIRSGFDKLAATVPGMAGQARSEAIVLGATVEHLRDVIAQMNAAVQMAAAAGLPPLEIQKHYEDIETELKRKQHEEEAAAQGLQYIPQQPNFPTQAQPQQQQAPVASGSGTQPKKSRSKSRSKSPGKSRSRSRTPKKEQD